MSQRIAAISIILCIGLLAGVAFVRPAFAQTSVMAPQPAKQIYNRLGFAELAKLVETGDAAAVSELQKRFAPKSDKPPARENQKPPNNSAPVLGTSKGLGVLITKPSTPKKLRSYEDMQKELDELAAKIKVNMAKIKAGTYSAADKIETAAMLKRVKEVLAEIKFKKLIENVDQITKRTKIIGETVKIVKKQLTFVWTMKPAELKAHAEKGDVEAQVELAHRYSDGKRGFGKNTIASFKWMYKASESGYATAQSYTARHYFNGDGVAKDDTKAANWLRKSAENGYKFAQFQLHKELEGPSYFVWGIFGKNLDQAEYWLNKAVAQGFEIAIAHKEKEHAGE